MSQSDLEAAMAFQLRAVGIDMEREVEFHPERKWRFDFADKENKIAVEVEGGVYARGRHTRGSGFVKDCKKYNEAELLGWTVLRIPGPWVETGEGIAFVERAYE